MLKVQCSIFIKGKVNEEILRYPGFESKKNLLQIRTGVHEINFP